MDLTTLPDLALAMRLPLSTVTELAARENWPHVRLGRAKRFTPEQVAEIIATHTVVPKHEAEVLVLEGQTKRSARSS